MRALVPQVFRFGLVGILTTAIHVALFTLLAAYFHGNAALANLIAFSIAWTAGFVGHTFFTFAAPTGLRPPVLASLSRYLLASLATLSTSAAVVHVVVSVIGLPYLYCVPLLVTVVPALAFLLNRNWVFRPARGQGSRPSVLPSD
jgi:putative flippase GtrA